MKPYTRVSYVDDGEEMTSYHPMAGRQTTRRLQKARPWVPTSLRGLFLGVIAAACLLIVIGLALLQWYSAHHDGLRLITSSHYAWTYGPTAIFVLFTSVWRLIDFHCKALTPWQELERGPALANRSLWLDHISEMLPVAFLRSVKMSHFAVAATIVGFAILKLVTLAATGLLLPILTQSGPIELPMTATTNLDSIRIRQNLGGLYANASFPAEAPLYNLYAILENGLPQPEGISGSIAYETFRPIRPGDHENATYRIPGKAFVPGTTCTVVEMQPIVNWTQYSEASGLQYWPISLNSSDWSCPAEQLNRNWVATMGAAGQICPPRQLYPIFNSFNCSSTVNADKSPTKLMIMSMVDIRYNQTFNESISGYAVGDPLVPEEWQVDIVQTTAVLCEIKYHIEEVELTYNMSKAGNEISLMTQGSSNNTTLTGVRQDTPAAMVGSAAAMANAMFGSEITYRFVEEVPVALPKLIAKQAGGDYNTILEDPHLLARTTERILSSLLAQVVHYVMVHDSVADGQSDRIMGQALYTRHRLRVQPISLALMLVGMSILTLLVGVVWRTKPRTGHVESYEHIWTTTKILQHSSAMNAYLKQAVTTDEKHAK